MFWLEILLVAVPVTLVLVERVRNNARALFGMAVMVIGGFLVNRLNVSTTGLDAYTGVRYFPSWMEVAITMSIVTAGMIAFRMAVQYLPVFHTPHREGTPQAVYAKS